MKYSNYKFIFFWYYLNTFINAIVSLFILQLSLVYNPAFYFNIGKKAMKTYIIFLHCFYYYRKNPNNDNKICPVTSSFCLQQHLTDFMYLSTIQICRNLNEQTAISVNYIRDLTNKCKLFSIPVAEYCVLFTSG